MHDLFETNLFVFKENFKTIMNDAIEQIWNIEMSTEKVTSFLKGSGRMSSFLKIDEVDEEAYLSERDISHIDDTMLSSKLISTETSPMIRAVDDLKDKEDIKGIVLTTVSYSEKPISKSLDKCVSKEETTIGSFDKKANKPSNYLPPLFKKKKKVQRFLTHKRIANSFHEYSKPWKTEANKKDDEKNGYIRFLLEKGKSKFSFVNTTKTKVNKGIKSSFMSSTKISSDKKISLCGTIPHRKIKSAKRHNVNKA